MTALTLTSVDGTTRPDCILTRIAARCNMTHCPTRGRDSPTWQPVSTWTRPRPLARRWSRFFLRREMTFRSSARPDLRITSLEHKIDAQRQRDERQQPLHSQARAGWRREFYGKAPTARSMAFESATSAGNGQLEQLEPLAYYSGK